MYKTLRFVDEKILDKIAKTLVKEFNENVANTDNSSFRISLLNRLTTTIYYKGGNPDKKVYRFDGGIEFPHFEGKSDIESFTSAIRDKFMEKVQKKVKKGILMIPRIKEDHSWGMWSSSTYHYWNGVTIIRPCKEYSKLVKRFEALGLEKLDPLKWNTSSVFGKRSDYSITDVFYHCTSAKACNEVLEFLKGKKRASYEIKRHDCMEDREYGERYETEWGGSIHYTLSIKTADKTREFGW